MERLFDPTKSHFAAWVWLYDIDRHWVEPMCDVEVSLRGWVTQGCLLFLVPAVNLCTALDE